mmetsp:Transcript_8706/g.17351  ORF Transcript_8706/g.17351 Transcript_8706/m.17351 type:complete len:200 (+) Transcript_8706:512-1111(+)
MRHRCHGHNKRHRSSQHSCRQRDHLLLRNRRHNKSQRQSFKPRCIQCRRRHGPKQHERTRTNKTPQRQPRVPTNPMSTGTSIPKRCPYAHQESSRTKPPHPTRNQFSRLGRRRIYRVRTKRPRKQRKSQHHTTHNQPSHKQHPPRSPLSFHQPSNSPANPNNLATNNQLPHHKHTERQPTQQRQQVVWVDVRQHKRQCL